MEQIDILRVTGDGVNCAEIERWANKLGYLEIWQQIVAKVDAPDAPPGRGRARREDAHLPRAVRWPPDSVATKRRNPFAPPSAAPSLMRGGTGRGREIPPPGDRGDRTHASFNGHC
jgi:hypothetical protein